MFGAFNLEHFPFVYMRIKSDDYTDETFEYYKSSIIQILYKAKMEKQKVLQTAIRNNIAIAATWEIDWSPDAGPFWLVLLIASMVAGMAVAALTQESN